MTDREPVPPPADVKPEQPEPGALAKMVDTWVGLFPATDYQGLPAVALRIESCTGSSQFAFPAEHCISIGKMMQDYGEKCLAARNGLAVPEGATESLIVPKV